MVPVVPDSLEMTMEGPSEGAESAKVQVGATDDSTSPSTMFLS